MTVMHRVLERLLPTALRAPALLLGATALLAASARADFTNPYTPPFRGQPGTEYGKWDTFTYAYAGANLPDGAGSTAVNAAVEQLDPQAFLFGGNIYSFATALQCVLDDSVQADLLQVCFQVSTKGSELDYAGVRLEYVDGLGVTHSLPWTSTTELARYASMGVDVETLFDWDLSGVADVIQSYRIIFDAAAASLSLDAVIIDTRTDAGPFTYCTGKVNSLGCTPQIAFTGVPSASGSSPFTVSASNLINNKNGLFFYGTHGPLGAPFQGGFLCVKAPFERTLVQQSGGNAPPNDCSGSLTFDLNAWIQLGLDPNLVAGQRVNGQFWARDPQSPSTTSLSNAIEFILQP